MELVHDKDGNIVLAIISLPENDEQLQRWYINHENEREEIDAAIARLKTATESVVE